MYEYLSLRPPPETNSRGGSAPATAYPPPPPYRFSGYSRIPLGAQPAYQTGTQAPEASPPLPAAPRDSAPQPRDCVTSHHWGLWPEPAVEIRWRAVRNSLNSILILVVGVTSIYRTRDVMKQGKRSRGYFDAPHELCIAFSCASYTLTLLDCDCD